MTLQNYIEQVEKELEERFTFHKDGIWKDGHITHSEYKPLTIENAKAFLRSKLTGLAHDMAKEVRVEEKLEEEPKPIKRGRPYKYPRVTVRVVYPTNKGFNQAIQDQDLKIKKYIGEV